MQTSAGLKNTAGVGVRLTDVSREFDAGSASSVVAVDRINLTIPAGQFIAILGPSGSGKSTLLRMIAGLDQPTRGTVSLESADEHKPIAYVFQDAHLLPWRNVLRNVALPLELLGTAKDKRLAAARTAIESVGLTDAIRRYPNQLSGGMRMRVSLARALVTNPKLLLLDEPFAALDEITRQQLDEQLRRLWLDRGMTVIFVTHSIAEATILADRAVVLSKRPAKIVHDAPIDLPLERQPELRTSTDFAKHSHVLFEALRGDGGGSGDGGSR